MVVAVTEIIILHYHPHREQLILAAAVAVRGM
jgi:hypothetical protein